MEDMPGWVEERARIEARLNRDGPEVWRDLRASIRRAVEDYTRFYSPDHERELEYSDCLNVADDNCIRVRTIPPPGRPDTSFEIRYIPDEWKIECSQTGLSFRLTVRDEKVGLIRKDGAEVSVEQANQAFLEPLIDKLPRRRPKITA